MQSDKEIELFHRDLLPKHGAESITVDHLPAVKGYKNSFEADARITANFMQSKKALSAASRQSHREAGTDGETGHPWAGTEKKSY